MNDTNKQKQTVKKLDEFSVQTKKLERFISKKLIIWRS